MQFYNSNGPLSCSLRSTLQSRTFLPLLCTDNTKFSPQAVHLADTCVPYLPSRRRCQTYFIGTSCAERDSFALQAGPHGVSTCKRFRHIFFQWQTIVSLRCLCNLEKTRGRNSFQCASMSLFNIRRTPKCQQKCYRLAPSLQNDLVVTLPKPKLYRDLKEGSSFVSKRRRSLHPKCCTVLTDQNGVSVV